ncbi:hypothetical protein MNBD_DELTA02-42 [hydrothermal vent metagenome]|uniref:Auxin efflux carrier family protein n=1 Tax=hydrothermal vent metagenome TaxID=652676 RepID=A0A3B0V3X3_9ZZZZ
MPVLLKVLTVVAPVFAVIGLGYIFARFRTISLKPVIDILLYLTIPALVITSLTDTKIVPGELFLITIAACGVVFGTWLMTFIYLKATGKRDGRGMYLTTMFMNCANIPFPIALLAFGQEGLSLTVLYYIAISILVYSLGIYIAKGKGNGGLTEIFRLPLIYATVLGLGVNFSGVELPAVFMTTMKMLGAATIPLMQISLGYQLRSIKITHLKSSAAASIIRIGGGLMMAWLIVTLLGIEGLPGQIIILTSAMPSAVITFVMSYRYDVQSEQVASTVALSTIISLVTIPLILFFIL